MSYTNGAGNFPVVEESGVRVAQGTTGRHTDISNAERLVDWFGADLRYCATWQKWLAWDGQRWRIDEGGRALHVAKETARLMLADAFAALERAKAADDAEAQAAAKLDVAHALAAQFSKGVNAMVKLAQCDPAVVVRHTQLDADPMLLNVANGTLDLRTGELRPAKRSDMMTKLAPTAFDPTATAPTWDRFLEKAMGGDAELVSFLQRFSGYSLTGSIREHKLLFHFGDGGRGKSTFLLTHHAMMGDYAAPAARNLIFRSNGEKHPTELAALHGLRFVTCSEIEEGQAFDEAKTKDLTGGDRIMARRMREDFWAFDPTHKLALGGNHKPTVRGDDEGIWRRLLLVPWLVDVPPEEKDLYLVEKLRAELPGILAWAVRGCLAWQKDGIGVPAAVREASLVYRVENDTLGQFFSSALTFDPEGRITRKELRELYTSFCLECGTEPLGHKRFAARLRERGAREVNVRRADKFHDGWRGVRTITDIEKGRQAWSVGTTVGRSGGQVPTDIPPITSDTSATFSGSVGTCGDESPIINAPRARAHADVSTGNTPPQVLSSPQPDGDLFSDYLDREDVK